MGFGRGDPLYLCACTVRRRDGWQPLWRCLRPEWRPRPQWKSRGAETLLAVHADTPTGLKKAAQSLRSFGATYMVQAIPVWPLAAVQALEAQHRLPCSDAAAGCAAGIPLEVPVPRRSTTFGAPGDADAKVGPKSASRAKLGGGDKPDPVRLALSGAQAARRIVNRAGRGCAERESDHVLVLCTKKALAPHRPRRR